MKRFSTAWIVLALLLSMAADSGRADTFGSGPGSFEIDFVTIGNPGNPADTTGNPNPAGSVPYTYRIGKYEISEQMIAKANAQSAANGESLAITIDSRGPDKPATSITWFEASRFVNLLNTSTGHVPAYKFIDELGPRGNVIGSAFVLWDPGDAGYDPANRFRNRLAAYVLPSADEWYKAAFYDPAGGTYFDYPTESNIPPLPVASGTAPGTAVVMQDIASGPASIAEAGGLSPYGTIAQAGNVTEWEETEFDRVNNDVLALRDNRGTGWSSFASSSSSTNRFGSLPQISGAAGGFRVGSVIPEPNTAFLVWTISPVLICLRKRRLQWRCEVCRRFRGGGVLPWLNSRT